MINIRGKVVSKESLYLDTSVPSAYYDEKTKERQGITIKFWREILPNYQVYVSEITVRELADTKDKILRKKLMHLIKSFKVLKLNKRVEALARTYIKNKIFPVRYIDDATHAAIASFYGISYLVSWNFEHLVKVRTRRLVNSVNILEGFSEIEIVSPQEL
jgi:predicted nucleic acid-binding protein